MSRIQFSVGVFAVDSNLAVVLWDGAMASLTSISPESALGQPLSAVLAEEESEDSLLGVVRETCRGKTSTLRQVSLGFNDGSEALFLISTLPLSGVSGRESAICVLRPMSGIPSLDEERHISKIVCSGSICSFEVIISYRNSIFL